MQLCLHCDCSSLSMKEMLVEAYISDLSDSPASSRYYFWFTDEEMECKRFAGIFAVDFRAASARVRILCFQRPSFSHQTTAFCSAHMHTICPPVLSISILRTLNGCLWAFSNQVLWYPGFREMPWGHPWRTGLSWNQSISTFTCALRW